MGFRISTTPNFNELRRTFEILQQSMILSLRSWTLGFICYETAHRVVCSVGPATCDPCLQGNLIFFFQYQKSSVESFSIVEPLSSFICYCIWNVRANSLSSNNAQGLRILSNMITYYFKLALNCLISYLSSDYAFTDTFSSWWNSSDFLLNCLYAREAFWSSQPTYFHEHYVLKIRPIINSLTIILLIYRDLND